MTILGCASKARDEWADRLNECVDADTLPVEELLYLGPSNVYGPGSAWREAASDRFEPRWNLESAIEAEDERAMLIVKGSPATCSGSDSHEWLLEPAVLLSSNTLPLAADLTGELKRADAVSVRVNEWRLDRLNELAYESWLAADSGMYAADVLDHAADRRVMKSAVLVKGFAADFRYGSGMSAELAAQYELGQLYDLGGSLSLQRMNEHTVHVESTSAFYVLGTLCRVTADGTLSMLGKDDTASRAEPGIKLPSSAVAIPPRHE